MLFASGFSFFNNSIPSGDKNHPFSSNSDMMRTKKKLNSWKREIFIHHHFCITARSQGGAPRFIINCLQKKKNYARRLGCPSSFKRDSSCFNTRGPSSTLVCNKRLTLPSGCTGITFSLKLTCVLGLKSCPSVPSTT